MHKHTGVEVSTIKDVFLNQNNTLKSDLNNSAIILQCIYTTDV